MRPTMNSTNEILRWTPNDPEVRQRETVRLCREPQGFGSVSVGDLTTSGPSIEFILPDEDLAALLRPTFIAYLLSRQLVGRQGRLTEYPVVDQIRGEWSHFITLYRVVDPDAPSQVHVTDILQGPHQHTIDVNLDRARPDLLTHWSTWMWEQYITFPGEDLVAQEQRFLTSSALAYPEYLRLKQHHFDQAFPPTPRLPGEPVRDLTRVFLRAVDPTGLRWPHPGSSTTEIREWMLEPDLRGLPRYMQMTYWSRPDLRAAFAPGETTVDQFVNWLNQTEFSIAPTPAPSKSFGRRVRGKLGRAFRIAVGDAPAKLGTPRAPTAARGVNVVGYLSAVTGLGSAARTTLEALTATGIPWSAIDLSPAISAPRLAGRDFPVGVSHDTTIFHLNPGELDGYLSRSLLHRSTASRSIGLFYWETEVLPPAWIPILSMVDEIWTATDFVAKAFRKAIQRPVHCVGYGLATPNLPGPDRSKFGWRDEEFVVLFIADAHSGIERKNPLALLDAFQKAFGPSYANVRLVLKVANLAFWPDYRAKLLQNSEGLPVDILERALSFDDVWTLIASADLYASLHCAEGLGLTMLEAMAAGVPVLATAYGGNTDFTTPQTAFLVDYEMTDASPGPGGIYRGHRWAQPIVDHAAFLLRHAYDHPEERREKARLGQVLATKAYSPEAYAATLADRLLLSERKYGHSTI